MNSQARFLLLVNDAARAMLLDSKQRILGEVIEEDGFIVESLLRGASPCALPGDAALLAMVPPPAAPRSMRCFELR